jgi:hypothetical protein
MSKKRTPRKLKKSIRKSTVIIDPSCLPEYLGHDVGGRFFKMKEIYNETGCIIYDAYRCNKYNIPLPKIVGSNKLKIKKYETNI